MDDRPGGLVGGTRVVVDGRVRLWRDGRTALGGAPWGVSRLGPASADLLRRLRTAAEAGLVPVTPTERAAADRLVERGLAHPMPSLGGPAPAGTPKPSAPGGVGGPVGGRVGGRTVEVVVPVYGGPDLLVTCLDALAGLPVVVVDDASPTEAVARVARERGARVIRHPVNRGPAAGRNTGLAATTSDLVAFVDADCAPAPGWLAPLVALFDDPRVGAVAPRVVPRSSSTSLLARHERARSALDMGARRALVRPGSPLGFLPSATLIVRRTALAPGGFDEDLRLGEDVDLVWRLADAGWHVRYEPSVTVDHEMRIQPYAWLRRRFEYGTSTAQLHRRHPGRLTPARLSGWNLAVFVAVLTRRPLVGAALAGTASSLLARKLAAGRADPVLAPVVVGMGLGADAISVGHALRREWWPLGWLALAAVGPSRPARAAAAAMLVPIAWEWLRERPDVDPVRYTALRLVEDAAYGCGVLASALRDRSPSILAPHIRVPYLDQVTTMFGGRGDRPGLRGATSAPVPPGRSTTPSAPDR